MQKIYVLTSHHHEYDVCTLAASFSEYSLIKLANTHVEESIELFNPSRLEEWQAISDEAEKFSRNNEFINANEDGDYGDFCEQYQIQLVEVRE